MNTPVAGDFYPMGLQPASELETVTIGGARVSRHRLTPDSLRELARGLGGRCARARAVPARRIIDGLASLHSRWADAESPLRQEAVAALHAATGYAAVSIDDGLRRLFGQMDAQRLESWLARGGVLLPALDAEPGEPMLAFGPELTLVVSSGNVPGAALPSVVQAVLLKSPCLVKTATAEPVLLPLYLRSLYQHLPELAQAVAATGWTGGDTALEAAVLPAVDALIAYGADDTIRSLRNRLPARARFLGYGHRLSFSAVGRELLASGEAARDAAERLALELCTYDQQGCYSPQSVFVEAGGAVTIHECGGLLAEALEAASVRIPRHKLSAAESAAIHQYRGSVEMRSFSDPRIRLWTSQDGTGWTVVVESSAELVPCVLNRTAVLRPIDALEGLPDVVRERRASLLAASLGVSEGRYGLLARRLGGAGLARVTQLGMAQSPADSLFHDGVNAVSALVRFSVVE